MFWQSAGKKGRDAQKLFEVPPGAEFEAVKAIFLCAPPERPYYQHPRGWARADVIKIERVENGTLNEKATTQHSVLRTSLAEQGISLIGGLHVRWLFHGTAAIEKIIENPVSGFEPGFIGFRVPHMLWGKFIYFARDAQYSHAFSRPVGGGGARQLLMCLVETGVSCVADKDMAFWLPYQLPDKHLKYHSAVDCISSPEIFCVGEGASAYPAYVITYVA